MVGQAAFPDLRSVTYGGGKLFVLDGEEGVNSLDPVSMTKGFTISLGEDYSGAKRTMDVHGETLVVSEGANGAGIYDLSNGAEQIKIQIPVVSGGLVEEEIVTNAVTTNEKHLFMANGSAGVSAVALGEAVETLGVLDLFGSSNYVRANDDYLFVASGLEGLQILKINLADDIVDDVCTDLPAYKGSTWMNINSGEPQGYSGSVVADGLNVNDDFTFC